MAERVNGHEPEARVFPTPDEQPPAETLFKGSTGLNVERENGTLFLVLNFVPSSAEAQAATVKIALDESGAIELAALLLTTASRKD